MGQRCLTGCQINLFQSEIASERPGVLDCLREGVARLAGWSTSQTTRLLPVWKLVTPVVVYGLCHYVVSSLAKYTVLLSMKQEIIEDKVNTGDRLRFIHPVILNWIWKQENISAFSIISPH